ncbi:hypothetical protein GW17_00032308 [Ensete ventricosum]|nr:hypothetical protein GW17_00032308 [Ensete ventricosum]
MALNDALDVKLETFKAHMEDKLQALFEEFRLGQFESPKRSQHRESLERKENQFEKGDQAQESKYPLMRVDFPRWEDGDLTGWISLAKRCFRFHKTLEVSMVDIIIIHLKGDVIQWYDQFKHTHDVTTWRQFKSRLLIRFGPSEYENMDGQLVKIRQTSTVQEYQTRFKHLSNQTHD